MKAVVLGSTGLVGGHLTNLLIQEPAFDEVVLINRRPANFKSEKIRDLVVDFDNLLTIEDELKADMMFCCLGTTIKKAKSKENFRRVDYDLPLEFAQMFSKLPHQTFALISAVGANSGSPIFYNQVKGELEDALKSLGLNRLVIIRPSLLLGDRAEKRIGEDIGKVFAPILQKILPPKYRPVQARDVAKAMLDYAMGREIKYDIEAEFVP